MSLFGFLGRVWWTWRNTSPGPRKMGRPEIQFEKERCRNYSIKRTCLQKMQHVHTTSELVTDWDGLLWATSRSSAWWSCQGDTWSFRTPSWSGSEFWSCTFDPSATVGSQSTFAERVVLSIQILKMWHSYLHIRQPLYTCLLANTACTWRKGLHDDKTLAIRARHRW